MWFRIHISYLKSKRLRFFWSYQIKSGTRYKLYTPYNTTKNVNTAYSSAGISGLGNEAITLSDTTLEASILNTLNGKTDGAINALSISKLTGSVSDLTTAYGFAGGQIINIGDESVTIDDTTIDAANLNTLNGLT